MNTVNIILMVLLSAMIGFAIGNICGKETMKRIFTKLLDDLMKGMKAASEAGKKGE